MNVFLLGDPSEKPYFDLKDPCANILNLEHSPMESVRQIIKRERKEYEQVSRKKVSRMVLEALKDTKYPPYGNPKSIGDKYIILKIYESFLKERVADGDIKQFIVDPLFFVLRDDEIERLDPDVSASIMRIHFLVIPNNQEKVEAHLITNVMTTNARARFALTLKRYREAFTFKLVTFKKHKSDVDHFEWRFASTDANTRLVYRIQD
ncbi:hypothetical protein MCHI_002006 [Candidatus Magnetoovum chiemensis]|nr:hypothetical protein MCHI_002006 [Candidatus Magnetoovum chiemensis]